MAVTCHLCGKELDALAGTRCRKCRRLVCQDCCGQPRQGETGGLCAECADQEAGTARAEDGASEIPSEPAPVRGTRVWAPLQILMHRLGAGLGRLSRMRGWVLFGLALVLVFVGVLFYPVARAQVLVGRLTSEDAAVAAQAQVALVAADGRAVRSALRAMARTDHGLGRRRAIEVLGRVRDAESLEMLRDVAEDPMEPEAVREAAEVAVVRIESEL